MPALNIGGPDNFVVRNPLNNVPYIPGSSLKGKLRSLIEIAYGETDGGRPTSDNNSYAGGLFGTVR
jgi:CRISPR-associated protein Csm3